MDATTDPEEGKDQGDEAANEASEAATPDPSTPEPVPAADATPEPADVDVRSVGLGPLEAADPAAAAQALGEDGNLALLLDIPVPVTVEVGRTKMQLQDLLTMRPGTVVRLDQKVGEPVDVVVNGRRVAQGEMVSVEEQLGVRITRVLGTVTG